MASYVNTPTREKLLASSLPDLSAGGTDVRIILVDLADYTPSAAHEFLTSIPGAARVAVSGALASKTITGGVFDAADVTIPSVTGDQFEGVQVYRHTGTDATSELLAFIDRRSDGVTAISFTPNGSGILVQAPSGFFII